jgi:hypothetical protein
MALVARADQRGGSTIFEWFIGFESSCLLPSAALQSKQRATAIKPANIMRPTGIYLAFADHTMREQTAMRS